MLSFLMDLSIDIIAFLQTHLAFLTPVMRLFTLLGDEAFYLLIMPFLVWSVDYALGMRLGVMLMLSGTLNGYLKVLMRQPRPYWTSTAIANLTSPMGSFGLPSGHSQNAASVFGLLVAAFRKKWHKMVMVLVILLVAFSRLFLGVHSLADILLGLALGFLLLWAFLRLEKHAAAYFRRHKPNLQLALALVLSLSLLMFGVVLAELLGSTPLPAAWLENTRLAHPLDPIAPYSIDGLITTTATLFGLAAGNILIQNRGGYLASRGKVWQHAARFVIGIAGVLLIWKGLGDIFPRADNLLGFSLRYLRYTLIGLWISGLAPLLFLKAKLAHKA